MKKILAIILAVAMMATMLAVSVSAADTVIGSMSGVLPANWDTETSGAQDLKVKVSNVTHKYAVDITFDVTVFEIGGYITWNVNTMKYDVTDFNISDFTSKITVDNRSDLSVYAYATVSDSNNDDKITVSADKNSATERLTVARANGGTATAAGTKTSGEITITAKPDTGAAWKDVAEYYANEKLANEAQEEWKIASVTVTISKDN